VLTCIQDATITYAYVRVRSRP